MSDDRVCPMQGENRCPDGYIPWWLAEIAHASYKAAGHGQSLESIAKRGGFGWMELAWLLEGSYGSSGKRATTEERTALERAWEKRSAEVTRAKYLKDYPHGRCDACGQALHERDGHHCYASGTWE